MMEAEHLRAIAARDQLWSSLRTLLPEIERLAAGGFDNSSRDQEVAKLLARIVIAELQFQSEEGNIE
jgi:hypothetical protein